MKHSPFTAIYDANVLYPAPLRDFLMNLALTGIYRHVGQRAFMTSGSAICYSTDLTSRLNIWIARHR